MGDDVFQFSDIHADRVRARRDGEVDRDARYVLYWMQQSQRTEWNHALEYAVRAANRLEKGLIVGFGLTADYPEANLRHYQFMLEGLLEVEAGLADRDIQFVLRVGEPADVCIDLAQDAALVVCDRGYLRLQRQWRRKVARKVDVPMVEVESDLVVPVEVTSDKQEYAARTIRKKLMSRYETYLTRPAHRSAKISSRRYSVAKKKLTGVDTLLDELSLDRSVGPAPDLEGGTAAAKKLFGRFLRDHLGDYDDDRNDPNQQRVSSMSPYLHFGQISPAYLIDRVRKKDSSKNRDSYIEELLVRRELAHNFVYYADDYDRYGCLPDWARTTLKEHKQDDRETIYTRDELESGATHDDYWNAAMLQMKQTGYLHNHLRMYWGKQIIRWCNTPEYAYETALYLNNKYFLDGRDANSYTNVAWLFGLHDRAWQERDVFGKVRTMTAGGLERKFDIQRYVDGVLKN